MKTFIFGASGFAKEVEWLIFELNKINAVQIVVSNFVVTDNEFVNEEKVNNIAVISESIYYEKYHKAENHNCIIAVGSPGIRKKIYSKIKDGKTFFPNIIHPSVTFDERYTKFGQGNIICAGVLMTTNIVVEDFVHINLGTTVGHDTNIGSFTTVSPGVNISGNVSLESNCFLGTGAAVLENIKIISESIIGAGGVVTKSIQDSGTYVGIPAKKIK